MILISFFKKLVFFTKLYIALRFHDSMFQVFSNLPQQGYGPDLWTHPQKPTEDRELTADEMRKSKQDLEATLLQQNLKLVPVSIFL